MISYALECLICQLVFLLTYDLFLKKETFFQWNRVYLLGTFVLSLVLPLVQIDVFKSTITSDSFAYPIMAWQLDEVVLTSDDGNLFGFLSTISWEYVLYISGLLIMAILLGVKFMHIFKLKRNSDTYQLKEYTKIVVPKSTIAFSFFRNIFMGKDIALEKQDGIIAHELVHIKQWHSLDLVFFELMRVVFWFNPLVYLYQNRMAELHEFIVDAEVSKGGAKKQYEQLLTEVFQCEKLSFVNQFFKQSLIKKRIVMLTKKESRPTLKLKYILTALVTAGLLGYTSCEPENSRAYQDNDEPRASASTSDETAVNSDIYEDDTWSLEVENLDKMSGEEKQIQDELMDKISESKASGKIRMVDKADNSVEILVDEGDIQSVSVNKQNGASMNLVEDGVPFGKIDEPPVFPGCEDVNDKKACFLQNLERHIVKNFRYPAEAKEQGIEGNVNILFRIGEDGNINEVRTRGPHKILEEEAERIIRRLPKMQPGKHSGEVVEVPFSLPITFKLD